MRIGLVSLSLLSALSSGPMTGTTLAYVAAVRQQLPDGKHSVDLTKEVAGAIDEGSAVAANGYCLPSVNRQWLRAPRRASSTLCPSHEAPWMRSS
ncbi:hypothetical protein DENSPDRAFT_832062 [Dentipellis sp. KUC8613]|nr:hypothetical protein DENSPDRAFT_832062 [Dentipellis sp. KUC8613]